MKATSQFLAQLGITRTSLIIDSNRVRQNIRRMVTKTQNSQVIFRPHFKTHQSGIIGNWFTKLGVDPICVSSVGMAQYFAELGWRDITIAMLYSPRDTARVSHLTDFLNSQQGSLGLLIDSVAAAKSLVAGVGKNSAVKIWLKVDTGYGRTGVAWDNHQQVVDIVEACGECTLAGLLTHSGHTYQTKKTETVHNIFVETVTRLQKTRIELMAHLPDNTPAPLISIGDTPSCCLEPSFVGVDEVRPGNFVFFDLMQLQLGSCSKNDLALAVACPVVGLYPDREQIVVHAGAVHLSREFQTDTLGRPSYGCLGTINQTTAGLELGSVYQDISIVSMSQEHGVVQAPAGKFEQLFGELTVGDLVMAWPVHSCLTANLFSGYRALDGSTIQRLCCVT